MSSKSDVKLHPSSQATVDAFIQSQSGVRGIDHGTTTNMLVAGITMTNTLITDKGRPLRGSQKKNILTGAVKKIAADDTNDFELDKSIDDSIDMLADLASGKISVKNTKKVVKFCCWAASQIQDDMPKNQVRVSTTNDEHKSHVDTQVELNIVASVNGPKVDEGKVLDETKTA